MDFVVKLTWHDTTNFYLIVVLFLISGHDIIRIFNCMRFYYDKLTSCRTERGARLKVNLNVCIGMSA